MRLHSVASAVTIASFVVGCGGLVVVDGTTHDDTSRAEYETPPASAPSSTPPPAAPSRPTSPSSKGKQEAETNGAQIEIGGGTNGDGAQQQPNVPPPPPPSGLPPQLPGGPRPIPMPGRTCQASQPFVLEDLQIEGDVPSVTSDELTLVYLKDFVAYESKRLPDQPFEVGAPFSSQYTLDTSVSVDGLSLDYVFDLNAKGTAGHSVRSSQASPFGVGAIPLLPSPHLPVWRHVTLPNTQQTKYYTSAWDESLHVVRNGVEGIALPKSMRWFAVTPDELVVHYNWFDNGVGNVDTLIARRASPSDPFGAPTVLNAQLTPAQYWAPLYVTWVSADDCVVYGWSYHYGEHKKRIFRAERK